MSALRRAGSVGLVIACLLATTTAAGRGVTTPGEPATRPGKPRGERNVIAVRLQGPPEALGELLLLDPQGRRVGLDPVRRKRFNEIPGARYGQEALGEDKQWRVVEIPEPVDGPFRLAVIGTGTARYTLLVVSRDRRGKEAGRAAVESVPISRGVMHHYAFDHSVDTGKIRLGGQLTDADRLLSFAHPSTQLTQVPAGSASVPLVLCYGATVRASSFKATVNDVDVTRRFAPRSARCETVALPLRRGSNLVVLSVDGALPSGAKGTSVQRLEIRSR